MAGGVGGLVRGEGEGQRGSARQRKHVPAAMYAQQQPPQDRQARLRPSKESSSRPTHPTTRTLALSPQALPTGSSTH